MSIDGRAGPPQRTQRGWFEANASAAMVWEGANSTDNFDYCESGQTTLDKCPCGPKEMCKSNVYPGKSCNTWS